MQAKNDDFVKSAMLRSFLDIYKQEGLKGLWRVSDVLDTA